MKVRIFFPLIVLSLITAACGLPANLINKSTESTPLKNDTGTQTPSVPAQSDSGTTIASDGLFKAEALSPIGVILSWDGLKAEKFLLEASVNGSEFANLAELSGTIFTYENFPAIADRSMKYRLTAINGSSQEKPLVVEVQTPAQKPNPLTVTMMIDMILPDPASMDFSNIDPETFDPTDPSSLGLSPTLISESAEIGPEGGVIKVSSSTGVNYTYTIPPGALDDTLTFTLTPISSIEEAPLTGGFLGGVQVQPFGLDFNEPATLTIEPGPGAIASAGELVASFNADPDGSEFYFTGTFTETDVTSLSNASKLAVLVPQANDGWVMKPWDIPQRKTGSTGLGVTTRSAIKKHAVSNPPTDKNAQAEQNAAAEDPDLAPLTPPAYADINTRSVGMSGWEVPLSLMSDIEFLYTKAKDKEFLLKNLDKAINNIIDQIQKNFNMNMDNCVSKDDFQAYYAAKNLKSPKNAFSKVLSSKYQKKYGTDKINDVLEKAQNCNLRLNVESKVTVIGPGLNITLEIHSEVPLKINYDNNTGSTYYSGTGPISYDTNTITVAGKCSGEFEIKSKNSIVVNKLKPVFSNSSAILQDFSIPGFTTPGSFTILKVFCPEFKLSQPLPRGTDMWGAFYTLTKFEDLSLSAWIINIPPAGGTLLAELETNGKRKIEDGNAEENTSFRLEVNK